MNRIGSEMVSVLPSNVVDRGLEPRSGRTKCYKIGLCCFSAKQEALRRKNKLRLVGSESGKYVRMDDMSIRVLLFQWTTNIKIQLGVLF
jgi:hypothetical protein